MVTVERLKGQTLNNKSLKAGSVSCASLYHQCLESSLDHDCVCHSKKLISVLTARIEREWAIVTGFSKALSIRGTKPSTIDSKHLWNR